MTRLKTLAATLAILPLGFVFAQDAAAQKQTLKMANWVPPIHHLTGTYGKWIETVREASGGNLEIKLDKSGLAKPPGQYDLAKNGVRDIAWGVAGYTPGRMPLIRAAEVPFASPNSATGSPALYSWYTKHGFDKKEFNDTKLITAFVHGPGLLHSKNKITTIDDLKGVKIRVGGGGVAIARNLGAVAVAMPATKAHESLQRGTTDAAFFPWEAVRGFRLVKLVTNHLEVPGGLYTTSFWVTASKKAWNKLSAANKAALMKAGGAAGSKLIGTGWDEADVKAKKLAASNKNGVQMISAAQLKVWRARVQPVYDSWIKKADAQGLDGKALLGELQAMMKTPTN